MALYKCSASLRSVCSLLHTFLETFCSLLPDTFPNACQHLQPTMLVINI